LLSARSIFEEIRSNDESFRLFCSVAAKGESQGGWENERIAELTRDPTFAARIRRHGADETKHGRIFASLLRKRTLEPGEVPDDTDYCMLLERRGIGLAHARLRRDEPLSDEELLRYLVHSRVTEQRAMEEIRQQRDLFGDDPELGKAVRTIADDEDRHLDYCHEELLRFAECGHRALIRRMLREYALVEIRTYRDVSLAVMGRMGRILGWSRLRFAILRLAIRSIYVIERLWTWRRMTSLHPPARPHALDAPQSAELCGPDPG
jgi:rubrerythrin